MTTPHTTSASRRSAATQAAVDRYAADPAAKAARSIALATAHGLLGTARVTVIERDLTAAAVSIIAAAFSVPSQSDPNGAHLVEYDAATDSATCDCAAGANGLPCGHAGAALISGRALLRADAALHARQTRQRIEAAAWRQSQRERRERDMAEAMPFQRAREQHSFSIWKADLLGD